MRPLLTLSLFASVVSCLYSATVPAGFIDTQWVTGLSSPTSMAFAPDGRLFVCQKSGALRVIKSGQLLLTPFVTLTVNSAGERGLLGIAFDPNFASNQYLYVYYTATTPSIHNRVSRFTANGDVALANSEVTLLDLNNLSSATNHNGGAMHFGTDGKLYVAVGENATSSNAQTLNNLLGKLLRFNTDPSNLIPSDNPFVSQASGNNRAIWALGLRNPFTFAVQPGTGRIFINDVGEVTWEEINDGKKGGNYGWPATEGDHNNPAYERPIFTYTHGSGSTTGNAITGGTFYNPGAANFPSAYTGRYFFADFTSNWIRQLDPANNNTVTGFASGFAAPVDLQVGPDGALYVLEYSGGSVHKVSYAQNQPPSITTQPASQAVTVGQTATFSVVASGSQPLSYQWRRNGTAISGATQSSYTTPPTTASDNGAQFVCVVTNNFGTATSNAATLIVTASSNRSPAGTITAPTAGTLYQGGQRINFAGTANDPEEGSLPASAFTWRVEFYHNDGAPHTHPVLGPVSGITSGYFDVPTIGETSPNVYYIITLTVHDSQGLTHVSTRDVQPLKVTLSLTADSPGNTALALTLDGQPVTEPYTFVAVAGMIRSIGAPTVNDKSFTFQSWSDGGAQTHDITVPTANATYTARYRRQ